MGQDLVGGLGPDERVAAVVPAVDERADRGDEFLDAGEGSASDGLASDDPEEHLDQVQPRPRRRGEVQRHRTAGDPFSDQALRRLRPRAPVGLPGKCRIRTGVLSKGPGDRRLDRTRHDEGDSDVATPTGHVSRTRMGSQDPRHQYPII